jgi:hypothetical protein
MRQNICSKENLLWCQYAKLISVSTISLPYFAKIFFFVGIFYDWNMTMIILFIIHVHFFFIYCGLCVATLGCIKIHTFSSMPPYVLVITGGSSIYWKGNEPESGNQNASANNQTKWLACRTRDPSICVRYPSQPPRLWPSASHFTSIASSFEWDVKLTTFLVPECLCQQAKCPHRWRICNRCELPFWWISKLCHVVTSRFIPNTFPTVRTNSCRDQIWKTSRIQWIPLHTGQQVLSYVNQLMLLIATRCKKIMVIHHKQLKILSKTCWILHKHLTLCHLSWIQCSQIRRLATCVKEEICSVG